MHTLSIDHARAGEILSVAFGAPDLYSPSIDIHILVRNVILGDHLTYRYLLVTGLLAKATHSAANPLALQSGSSLPGAYDARSLCHKVLVPFELSPQGLAGRLGGSNEPFLNKPARFKELSPSNPVRRGLDSQRRDETIRILSSASTSEVAFDLLCVALQFAKSRTGRYLPPLEPSNIGPFFSPSLFAEELLAESFDGQASVLACGLAMHLYYSGHPDTEILVHPVNQSGHSSKEVLDIDIVAHVDRVLLGIEVKDKPVSISDVQHVCNKARASRLPRAILALGPRAFVLDPASRPHLLAKKQGVDLAVFKAADLLVLALHLHAVRFDTPVLQLWDLVRSMHVSARFTTPFLSHTRGCLERAQCYKA